MQTLFLLLRLGLYIVELYFGRGLACSEEGDGLDGVDELIDEFIF